jgi:hypothetical protein
MPKPKLQFKLGRKPKLQFRIGHSAPTRMYIALGPKCYGTGDYIEEACTNMLRRWPKSTKREGWLIQIWNAPRSATVTGRGGITWPAVEHPAIMIEERRVIGKGCIPEILEPHPFGESIFGALKPPVGYHPSDPPEKTPQNADLGPSRAFPEAGKPRKPTLIFRNNKERKPL